MDFIEFDVDNVDISTVSKTKNVEAHSFTKSKMNREYNKAFFKKFDNDWLPQIFSRQQKYNGKWRLESCGKLKLILDRFDICTSCVNSVLDENQLRAEPSTKPFDQQTADCNRLKTWLMREIIAVHKLDDRIGSNKSVKDNMPLLNLWVDEILKSKFLWLKENFQQLHFSDSKSFYNIERIYENVTRSRIW